MPLVLAVVALIVVVLLALVPLARAARSGPPPAPRPTRRPWPARRRGRPPRARWPRANGAELVSWQAEGLDVWVVVALGEARAEAKARRAR